MTPAEFLALIRDSDSAAKTSTRVYQAVHKGEAAETLLTLHTRAGNFEAFPYNSLLFATGDEAGGKVIRLIFPKAAALIHGEHLAPVFEAVRSRSAAHLYEFITGRYDAPQPGEPIITEFVFEIEGRI